MEMTMGAVVAGPFDVAESVLSGMIQRAIEKWKSGEVEKLKTQSKVH
jgi:hypothetical protein